jgi:hypothetical protein
MNTGMLWFDNDPRTALAAKIERAADYYQQKYHAIADTCLVHPSTLVEPHIEFVEAGAGKVAVRANRAILPGHLWIGVGEK